VRWRLGWAAVSGLFHKIAEAVIVQNVCDGIAHIQHNPLNRAILRVVVRVRAVFTFLIGCLAHTGNGGERAIKDSNHLTERDFLGGFDQAVSPADASTTGQKSGVLERKKNLLEKLNRNSLTRSDFMTLKERPTVSTGELDQRSQRILALLREIHGAAIVN
jgi:hypothetical protein